MATEIYTKPNFGRRVRKVVKTVLKTIVQSITPLSPPICVAEPFIVVEQGEKLRIAVKDGHFIVADGDTLLPLAYDWRINDVLLMGQHASAIDVEGNIEAGDVVVCVVRATSDGGTTAIGTNAITFS